MLAPGALGRLAGFWECCCRAVLPYLGCEFIGIMADETERPREILPKAAKRIATRAAIYYVLAAFVITLNVSSNDPILVASMKNSQLFFGGFHLMLQRAGLGGLGQVVHAVSLLAALGVSNAYIYVGVGAIPF